ncbi:hypothetical protein EV356DRAFT_509170 [Viridothelium virens]|uniref:Uncharacterized protein n=1 Tax=Viridothelium virens TaxID=1048519 RepID=A0A6A6GXM4_VIRVR|nr:hypothetical protein EV356DRAFT_509170 [Viridothelium virens]
MKTFTYIAGFAALIGNVLASPVATATMWNPIAFEPLSTATATSSAASTATCTTNIFYDMADRGPACTSYAATTTITSEIDCKGCALQTRQLGFGLVSYRSIPALPSPSSFDNSLSLHPLSLD